MTYDDVAGAEQAWHRAHSTLRASYHQPNEARTEESAQRMESRIAHLLGTDPFGSFVAVDGADGRIVGVAQALRREELWVLSLLGVSPDAQDRGVGRARLDAALEYGKDVRFGLILCSRDPRAARRYSLAGFDLHPAMSARGNVDRRRLPSRSSAVREGTADDAEIAADLDRRVRRGRHGADLEYLLSQGCRFVVLGDRAYAVARGATPMFLSAATAEDAAELLVAVLSDAEPDEV